MSVYTVKEPVRLDVLTKAVYGSERDGCLEALLAANAGLADDPFVVEGATIVVPPKPAPPAAPIVNPWE